MIEDAPSLTHVLENRDLHRNQLIVILNGDV